MRTINCEQLVIDYFANDVNKDLEFLRENRTDTYSEVNPILGYYMILYDNEKDDKIAEEYFRKCVKEISEIIN